MKTNPIFGIMIAVSLGGSAMAEFESSEVTVIGTVNTKVNEFGSSARIDLKEQGALGIDEAFIAHGIKQSDTWKPTNLWVDGAGSGFSGIDDMPQLTFGNSGDRGLKTTLDYDIADLATKTKTSWDTWREKAGEFHELLRVHGFDTIDGAEITGTFAEVQRLLKGAHDKIGAPGSDPLILEFPDVSFTISGNNIHFKLPDINMAPHADWVSTINMFRMVLLACATISYIYAIVKITRSAIA